MKASLGQSVWWACNVYTMSRFYYTNQTGWLLDVSYSIDSDELPVRVDSLNSPLLEELFKGVPFAFKS